MCKKHVFLEDQSIGRLVGVRLRKVEVEVTKCFLKYAICDQYFLEKMWLDVFLQDQSIGRLVGVRLRTSQGDQCRITS